MVNGHQPPAPAAPNDYAADAAAAAAADVDAMPPPPPVAPTAPSLAYHDAALVVDSSTVAASDAAVSHRPPPLPAPSVLPAAVVEGMVIPEEEPLNVVIQPVQQQQKSTTTTTAKSKTPPPSPKRQAHFQQLPHEEPQQHQKLKQPKLLKKPQDLQPDRPISLNLRQRMMSMNSTHSLNMEAMEAAVDNSSVEDHHLHDNLSIKPKRHAHNVSDISFPEAVSESSAATTTTTGPAAAPVLVAPLSPRLEKEEQAEEVKPVIVSLPSSLPPLRPPPPPTVTVPLHCSIQQQHQQQRQFSADSRIRLGICAMDKKARSRPMTQILSRLDDAFEVVFFGDDLILNHDITEWPLCDVVIAFFSKGYPLAKAKEYVALRQPFILNDLEKQELLQDRRKVYDLLEASGIDVPRHVYLSRDGYVSTGTGDGNGAGDTEVQEFDDHVIVNGMQIHKPFVEKPVNAEDHNIAIYYPTTAGGGCKKLFRKIGNRSSEFYPNINEVRRDGSYIYEEFVETQGTDVKMYTVGPEYGHAEARKSPTIDGKVERNSDGKEVRFPVILTFREKEIARRIVLVFQQFVCGFDILRVQEGHAVVSYVCDVNGWSFVKNSRKYYDDCAQILSEHILALVKPSPNHTFSTLDPLVTIANMSLHQLPEESGTVGGNGDDETISDGASIIDGPSSGYPPMPSGAASVGSASNNNNNNNATSTSVSAASPLVSRAGRKNTFLTRATRMLQGDCVSGDDDDDDEYHEYFDNHDDGAMIEGGRSGGGGGDDKSVDDLGHGELSQYAPQQQQQQQQPLAIFTTRHARSPSRCPETGELLSNAAATLVEGAVPVREFPNNLMSEPASLAQSSNSSYADLAPCEYTDNDGYDGDAQLGLSDLEEDGDETGNGKGEGVAVGRRAVGRASRTEKKTTERSNAQHNNHHRTSSSSERANSGRRRRVSSITAPRQEELRCVLAIIRHGDRTPKQKLKVNMTEPHILKYFHDHSKGAADKDLKVKAKQPMTEFLETVKTTLFDLTVQTDSSSNASSDAVASIKDKDKKKNKAIKAAAGVAKKGAEQGNLRHQLMHMRDVLERWKIAGLNRKLQIKPKKFEEYVDETTGEVKRRCTQVQLILKWGGNLTKLGEKQAINLGHKHRRDMYPDAPGGGILRLHSTFRHDLKIKTSDEGRVMKTAAAFAKGLLELEGDLPPILVSLVHKEKGSMHMLDPSGNKEVKMELDECKEKITANLQRDIEIEQASEDDLCQLVGPKELSSLRSAIQEVGNPRKTLVKIHQIMGKLINQLEEMLGEMGSGDERRIEGGEGLRGQDEFDVALSGVKLYKGETLLELTERWRFIYDRLYDAETDQFDLSRIPDVHDNVRFDVLHNPHLGLSSTFEELYQLAKRMADCVVPQEYGTTIAEKRSVGVKICHGLLEKIKYDLSVARTDNEVDMRYMINMAYSADLPINTMGRRIRTRLYFTSESHLHTVLSVFRFAQCEQESNCSNTTCKKRRKRHKHPLLSERGMAIINGTPELCYLTQIVMRVFEDNRRAMDDPCRFRVEILFSPGATATPRVMNEKEREQDTSRFDTAPLQVIGRDGLTCQEVEDFFEQAIMAGRTDEDTPYDVASTVAMPESPPQHQMASMPNKDIAVEADDAQGQQNSKAVSTAETGSETALQNDTDKPLGNDEARTGDNNDGKNDGATSASDENASTLTMSNRASMGRALLKERMELDAKSEAAADEKEATDVSQTRSLGLGKDADAADDTKSKEDKTKDSTSSNDELSTTRKYFWGAVAVASFGLGAACLFMALTFPRDRRGGYRRWSTTRGRY